MIKKEYEFVEGSSSALAKEAYVPLYKYNKQPKNITLGLNTSAILIADPKLVLFTLSKYKFAGKILEGCESVLEIGCMDGLGSLLLSSFVRQLVSIDFFTEHIRQAKNTIESVRENITFVELDFLDSQYTNQFDGIVCYDVLEHVDPEQTDRFIKNIKKALKPKSTAIIGMPSLESQIYASDANKRSHINCMTQSQGIALLSRVFASVFPLGMNDEVIHTGYAPMCHYHIYVCNN